MKTTKLLFVTLFSMVVAACGGGGGSNGGNTGGTTAPSYVVQGGLTWMPETFQDTWANANAYCANTTINGQTGWRMPTQIELSALYTSGLMKGHGWALSYDWSSTPNGAGNHYTVGLYDGSIHTTNDTSTFYVSCVRADTGGNTGGGASISLAGVTANGVALNGNLIAPVTIGNHTYYYWDASGDGISSSGDSVTHNLLDQIFNGGIDTTDTSGNVVILSNGTRLHLPTQAELLALKATNNLPSGWRSNPISSPGFWAATNSPLNTGFHEEVGLGLLGFYSLSDDTSQYYAALEVLDAADISATAFETPQNLYVGLAMSFSPLTPIGGATPYTLSCIQMVTSRKADLLGCQ